MKLYRVKFERHDKTYYVVESDEEAALVRAFHRAVKAVLSTESMIRVYPPPGRFGAAEIRELCDAKDLVLDALDILDKKDPGLVVGVDRASGDSFSAVQKYQNKPENPDKVLDAGSR